MIRHAAIVCVLSLGLGLASSSYSQEGNISLQQRNQSDWIASLIQKAGGADQTRIASRCGECVIPEPGCNHSVSSCLGISNGRGGCSFCAGGVK